MRALLIGLLALTASCHGHRGTTVVVRAKSPRTVSIEVEVFDPVTGLVWENVGVRVVEAEQEWSGCICRSPFPDNWEYSDSAGLVFFDALDLGDSEVGFVEDSTGRAIVQAPLGLDQAFVLLEVWAPGFRAVHAEVEVNWDAPNVFVSVPFEE